jgi:hypothetical protein
MSRRLAAVAVLGAVVVAAQALTMAAGDVVKNTKQPVTWSGVVRAGIDTGGVPECAPGCSRFDLRVDLPESVWTRPGGLQVSIRWSAAPFDNLRLYVYRNGSLLASSDGIIAIAQGVLIRDAVNGVYEVYAAYDPDSPSTAIAFDGLAEVEYDPLPAPSRRLMPDLEARPQQNLGFDPGGIFFDNISAVYPSCYQTEVDEEGAQTCLRFDQTFANVGEGPMELRFSVPTGAPEGSHDAFQRLHWSDGPPEDRPAGQVEYHPEHGHFHFASFGLSRLWKLDAAGNRSGRYPVREKRWRDARATPERTGRKVSFCLADTTIDAWGKKGDGPRQYIAPDCLFPFESDGVTDYFMQGITQGWADIYDWYLPDQYIEVTGVANGLYALDTIADPDNLLLETDESNNCESILIRLSNMGTPQQSAQIVGRGPRCSALDR